MASTGDAASGAYPGRAGAPATLTARGLGYVVLAGLTVLVMIAGAGLTDASETGWAGLVVGALVLWAGWLYWRTAMGDRDVPAHLLHPFLAVAVLILAAHLAAGGYLGPDPRQIRPPTKGDFSVVTRLMTLALLLLLVQDVMSRVRHLRWLLTGIGSVLALGALLRLYSGGAAAGASAVAMGGFVGVGILLTPCWLPKLPGEEVFWFVSPRLRGFAVVGRTALAAMLAALLLVARPQSAQAAALAATAVGGALLLAGVILTRHRLRLLVTGAALAVAGAAALWQMGAGGLEWMHRLTLLGSGRASGGAGASGLRVIAASAGWVGAAVIAGGMLLTLARSLHAARTADLGDQARAALWAAVAAMAGCALLVPGGMTVAATTVAVAVAWGLMPRVMLHRVRKFGGLAVVAAFAAALAVLALEQTVRGSIWYALADRYGDGLMHLFATSMLTVVLCWQVRARRWWQALACALAAGTVAAIGELGQKYLSTRSPEWRDVGWDWLGAGAALGVFLVMYGIMWIERVLAAPKASTAGYELWRRFAGPSW